MDVVPLELLVVVDEFEHDDALVPLELFELDFPFALRFAKLNCFILFKLLSNTVHEQFSVS